MKRKLFFVCLVLVITMFLVGCGGSGIPTTPPVTSNQSPIASFTATSTSGVAPLEVSFNASSSSDSDGSIVSYAWDFKDGDIGNGEAINHTFSSIGSYNVLLTVTDDEGATDLDIKAIIVTTPEPTPETIFPSREEAMETIKANAYDYWGDDYIMVQWEIDRQTEAYDWLVKQTEYPNIMSNAYDYWGDDYCMVKWEYERQVEAYEGLQ